MYYCKKSQLTIIYMALSKGSDIHSNTECSF